ncbi:MAG TPA: helix-turn-helix domain-containing protein [Granulicella sp.]|jgi:DNA-binding HxlR family transcriptional regulator
MRRASLEEDQCPIARSLEAIGDWWSLLIIRDAFDGLRRFGEFEKNLGVAKNILTVRLRKLVADGILKTVPASDGSRHQEYLLTEKGEGLFYVIVGLRQWGEAHFYKRGETHSVLIDLEKRRVVGGLELRSKDGRLLGPADTQRIFRKEQNGTRARNL